MGGALATDDIFQRIDQTSLHQADGQEQAGQHGASAKPSEPRDKDPR